MVDLAAHFYVEPELDKQKDRNTNYIYIYIYIYGRGCLRPLHANALEKGLNLSVKLLVNRSKD